MRYDPHTYEGAKSRANQIIARLYLMDCIPDQSIEEWDRYVRVTDPIEGKAQTNMEWSRVNNRNGYQNDIPGLISEIISQCCLAKLHGKKSILIAQDKETQFEKKIDFFCTHNLAIESSVQVKTVRMMGDRVRLDRSVYAGIAKSLCLVDIDSHFCCFLDREKVKDSWTENRGDYWFHELKEATTHWFDTNNDY